MHEDDHARNGNATTPDAHQEQNRDRRPQEPSTDGGRRKPGGPFFPVEGNPDPEPEKSGARNK